MDMAEHISNTANTITPLDSVQQQCVIAETNRYIRLAADYYKRSFEMLPVLFDLRGKAAGMYRVRYKQKVIRYNSFIFSKYFDDNYAQTIPHEVAHYISDELYNLKNIRPHGAEWKSIMEVFGAEPARTCNYNLSGIPLRNYRKFIYQCACQNYELTTRRHNKVLRGQGQYLCRQCGEKLLYVKKQD